MARVAVLVRERQEEGLRVARGWPPAPLIAVAAGLFPLLAALRHLDDNSLTSWAWTLEGRNLVGLWVLHLAAVAAAVLLSRRELPERWQLPAVVLAAFAAGVSLAGQPEAVIDASRYFVQAKHLALHGPAAFFRDWGGAVPAWTDLPLASLLYGTVFRLFGEHRLPQQLLTAGLLVKYSTWVLLGASCGLILLLELFRGGRQAALRGALAAAAGALAPALFALAKPQVVERQLALLSGFQWEGLRRWVESYPSTFLFQTHPLLAVAALGALWVGWRERDRRVLVAAALPLVLLALGIRRTRYLLPAYPMIALLAARGLEPLPASARRFAALAAVGQALVMALAVNLPFLQWVNTTNLMAAGRFLDERGVAAAEVWVQPAPGVLVNPEAAVPLLDYHTAARVVVRGSAPARPPEEELRVSSFRFTWEQPLAPWYRAEGPRLPDAAQVLITGIPEPSPPGELALRVAGRLPDAVFARDAVFLYRTFVWIWLPRDGRR